MTDKPDFRLGPTPELAGDPTINSGEREQVAGEFAWVKARGEHLARAEGALERAFAALAVSVP